MKCSVIARSANPVLGESAAALPTPPITKLATPQTPSVGYDIPSNLLTVTWEPVAGASEYWLDVIDASDASVLRSLCLPATVAQATVAWADIPTTATACRLAIRAGGDASHLDSAATTEVTIQVLGAPAGLEAIYASPEDELSVRWTADPEATSHEVIVTDATGAALNPAPMIALAPVKGATISGPAIVAGSSYRVRARSLGVGHVATWSDWMTVNAQFVPAPKGVSLSYANRALIATWQAVPSATEYRVAIIALATGAEVAALQTAATAAGFGQGTSITAGAVYVVAVRAQVATSVGPAGTAEESAPDLLAWLGNLHAQGTTADAAAMAARTFAPAAGPACLFAMLAAAGYPAVDAASGTTTQFPQADLTAEIAALHSPAVLAPILQAAGVGGPTIVAVTARLYAGLPVELAIQLRIGGLAQADVAAALPSACAGVSAADAMAIAGAAYVAPWALGGALHAAPVPDASVVPDLFSAYPALSAVEAAGTLKGAGYDLMHAGVVPRSLGAHYAAGDYADALEALADETGGALARLLHAAGVAADAATSYAAASFPTLTADAVQTAITAAYDTPQPT
jgi:hypothetical protein